jgi:hypothetical protein
MCESINHSHEEARRGDEDRRGSRTDKKEKERMKE